MFENLNFWRGWPLQQRATLFFFLSIVFVSFALLIVSFYSGGAFIINWEDHNTTQTVRVVFDKFYAGLYEFSIFADNHFIVRSLIPGEISIDAFYSYAFLTIFSLCILFLYAMATTLSRFYFLLSSVFFAVILLTYRWENLVIFGFYGKEVYAGILVLFLGIGYYIHAFRDYLSMPLRFLTFVGLGVIVFVVAQLFSQVEAPFLYLSSYMVVAPLILSVIFILMLGFEIVRGFLQIVSQMGDEEGKSNFLHFAVITIVYLVVLTLIFLHRHEYIEWKIVFIDAVWILIVAAIVGFWGFRAKEELYNHIFSFRPIGAYIYLILAFVCVSSFTFFFLTANDPYVEVLTDAIIISQMCFGLLFLIYVFATFLPMMVEGHAVLKVLYKPKFMPYFSANLASMVGVMALFFLIRMAPYYQAFSGYYISLAQLFERQDNVLLAKEYYKLANVYGMQTHMANYALAELASDEGNLSERDQYLALAINKNPTAYAYARFANGYSQKKKTFDEIFTLKNGVNQFPDSGPLRNNLGLAFSKINIVDTALFHLQKALAKNNSELAARINMPVVYTKRKASINWDSLASDANTQSDLAVRNNFSVLYKKNNREFKLKGDLEFGDNVSHERIVYNHSLLFNHPELADSTSWKSFRDYYRSKGLVSFEENLEYAFGHAFAKTGKSNAALNVLQGLNRPDNFGYSEYDVLMAQILMKFEAPEMALPYFKKTIRFYNPEVSIQYLMALMESRKLDSARMVINAIAAREENPPVIVNDLREIIETDSVKQIVEKTDHQKYNFLRYKGHFLTTTQYEGVILTMEDEGYQYAAYISLIRQLLEKGNLTGVPSIIEKVDLGNIQTPHIKIEYLKSLIRYYWHSQQPKKLSDLKPYLDENKRELGSYYLLYELFVEENTGDTEEKKFEELGYYDAFCEECITYASDFFYDKGLKIKSYNILLENIRWNKNSIVLNKEYMKVAVEIGLVEYAEDVLENLSSYLDEEARKNLTQYLEQQIAKNDDGW